MSATETEAASRYELKVTPEGEAESRKVTDYFAEHPGDVDALVREGDDLVGYVHSWEAGSTVDGPGVRFVGFLTGCPLRCQYCHNPDTWHKFNGVPVTIARAMARISSFAQVLKLTQGGVTISGGEAQLQKTFLLELFRRCHLLGLHTAIETSGRLGAKFTDEELELVDLHLLDIKSGDPATYEKVTRQPLQPTLDFARRLSALGRPMWVRFTLVPGLTDARDNVELLADICAGLKTLERVEIQPFHQMGKEKWHRLGLTYPLEDTQPPGVELIDRVRGQFRSRGLTVY
ncbi:MAG TPA: pyruvate formate-lyase-activating protein [Myxococcaceae bacterium]|nr:pyruvate formate-lyase-activating protein [Myxococcaceae bacterium]